MLESSFLCFPNGVCILIFNVLLNKAVCQHRPNLVKKAPVPGKGPLRKHFKSFIQCWLASLLAWRLSTFHQTCRIVEHILSERAREPRREQVAGTSAIKQMLLVGIG